ncbi:WLM domain-containing protein [Jimgerdemannia flammicorona]|uniref:WLM domain-containing protein n=1 Tax=Jimgerdemannia flammicorona TaxID=994334 RepID=A0A433QVZ2_9FUNG|nr:WLM domain-containing protein [Jimgerdemannia flammicorona]
MSTTISFQVTFKGRPITLTEWPTTRTVLELKQYLSTETQIPPESQKLLYKSQLRDEATLAEAKVVEKCKIMMIGTSTEEIESMQNIERRIALRKQEGEKAMGKGAKYVWCDDKVVSIRTVADDKYTFHRIEVIAEFPFPEKARELLERLRDDKGVSEASHHVSSISPLLPLPFSHHLIPPTSQIRAIMSHYKWSVGVLTELTPFDRSILGFNRNAGQLISLRLRTNALDGFRHYDSIRKVLLHELAHNVHVPEFHALDRQLNKDVVEMDWTAHGGRSLSAGDFYNPPDADEVDRGSSVTYEAGTYLLGGSGGRVEAGDDEDPKVRREKVVKAAMMRLSKEEAEIVEGCGGAEGKSEENGKGKGKGKGAGSEK